MKERIENLLIVFVAFVVFPLVVIFFHQAGPAITCTEIESQAGIKTNFNWITGCWLTIEGKRIPLRNWKVTFPTGLKSD